MHFINRLPNGGNIALLNNHSGSGHIEVVNHLLGELKVRKPRLHAYTPDALNVALSPLIGTPIVHHTFNKMQRNGDIKGLNHGLTLQWFHNYVLLPFFVLGFFLMMVFYNVDHVITPQPIGIKAMVLAARIINFFRSIFWPNRPPIKITMVLTELPTKDTENFFYNLRQLSAADRKIFKLVTTRPLLEGDQSEADFWEKNTGLSMKNVIYDSFPIRSAFLKRKNHTMRPDLSQSVLPLTIDGKSKDYTVAKTDEVFMVMLGSQANKEASIEYTKETIQYSTKQPQLGRHLFVFCGRDTGKDSLFETIEELSKKQLASASQLSIVPLGYQSAETVASILSRSNSCVVECGGLTSMELAEIKPAAPFIHAKDGEEPLEDRMLRWGYGNARYLEKNIGAQIVSPTGFAAKLEKKINEGAI